MGNCFSTTAVPVTPSNPPSPAKIIPTNDIPPTSDAHHPSSSFPENHNPSSVASASSSSVNEEIETNDEISEPLDESFLHPPLRGIRRTESTGDNNDSSSSSSSFQLSAPIVLQDSSDDSPPDDDKNIGCVLPFLGTINATREVTENEVDTTAPSSMLRLDHVYGARQFDSRNNLFYLSAEHNTLAYPSAGLIVCTNLSNDHQTYATTATDDVTSLAYSRNRGILAYGEMGAESAIHIYDPLRTQSTIAYLYGTHKNTITHVGLSPSGDYVASIDSSANTTLCVYNWTDYRLSDSTTINRSVVSSTPPLFSLPLTANKVLALVWKDEQTVLVGTDRVMMVIDTKNRTKRTALWGTVPGIKPQPVLSIIVLNNGKTIVTGMQNGQLYEWKGNGASISCIRCIDTGNTSPVTALVADPSGSYGFVSGLSNGSIRFWTNTFQPLNIVNNNTSNTLTLDTINNILPTNGITSLDWDHEHNKLFIGTKTCGIYEMDTSLGKVVRTVTEGHFAGETWGLAPHPILHHIVATTGDDGYLRIWDTNLYQCMTVVNIGAPARTVAWTNATNGLIEDINQIAIGLGRDRSRVNGTITKKGTNEDATDEKDGTLVLYSVTYTTLTSSSATMVNVNEIYRHRIAKAWISDLKFSPDNSTLTIAAHDLRMYILNMQDMHHPVVQSTVTSHKAGILHIDYSTDGTVLQSQCGAHELLFTDVATGKQIASASSIKGTRWFTQTCTLGWSVNGIWPPKPDYTDVNCCDRTTADGTSVLATGDDFGAVKLFRYPVVKNKQAYHRFMGHSSHVTCVRWNNDGRLLYSVGGADKTLMQWKLA